MATHNTDKDSFLSEDKKALFLTKISPIVFYLC